MREMLPTQTAEQVRDDRVQMKQKRQISSLVQLQDIVAQLVKVLSKLTTQQPFVRDIGALKIMCKIPIISREGGRSQV